MTLVVIGQRKRFADASIIEGLYLRVEREVELIQGGIRVDLNAIHRFQSLIAVSAADCDPVHIAILQGQAAGRDFLEHAEDDLVGVRALPPLVVVRERLHGELLLGLEGH